ncbi:hypothetical protein [Spirosoma sordidisoli]|uniref:3-hydroxyacyl-ACP dehydratase n=2 Tax=Spirosoma TaxID=107 RepID=A0A4Q2ULA8_9BACT|nr:hypothetical protein [Spirosoma sordidisoli]RYC68461.1 hypothetical protein EQG79_19065 [Spirosoma sordidisoli]
MTEPLVAGSEAVMTFIPHRPPFVLVDTLYVCTDDEAVASFTIPEAGHVLVQDGLFQEPGLLEHQAQVSALQAGYQARQYQLPPQMGYVAGFRHITIHGLPRSGEVVTTTVHTLTRLGSLTALRAETRSEARLLASCEFTVVLEPA